MLATSLRPERFQKSMLRFQWIVKMETSERRVVRPIRSSSQPQNVRWKVIRYVRGTFGPIFFRLLAPPKADVLTLWVAHITGTASIRRRVLRGDEPGIRIAGSEGLAMITTELVAILKGADNIERRNSLISNCANERGN